MRKVLLAFVLLLVLLISGCASAADTVSQNISREADQFKIYRRVVFYNGITDTYMLNIEGLCSLGNYDSAGELTVTCKIAEGRYMKHFLGLSDNVSYIVEQLESSPSDPYHYKIYFRPETIIPDIDLDTSVSPAP